MFSREMISGYVNVIIEDFTASEVTTEGGIEMRLLLLLLLFIRIAAVMLIILALALRTTIKKIVAFGHLAYIVQCPCRCICIVIFALGWWLSLALRPKL